MNRFVTLTLAPLLVGLTLVMMVLVRFADRALGAWEWCIVAVLALGLGALVAWLTNL